MRPRWAPIAAVLVACQPQEDPSEADPGSTRSLLHLEPVALSVPADSRSGVAPPTEIPLGDDWSRVGGADGASLWEVALPFRPRALFFFGPLPGMTVRDATGARLPHRNDREPGARSWRFNARSLTAALPAGEAPPGAFTVVYPQATERERRLNRAWSGAASDLDFARASLQVGPTTRSGLLLPAPAEIAWEVTVPPRGALLASFGLIPPEVVDGPASDGADVVVDVTADGVTERVFTTHVDDATFPRSRVDLSRWAGRDVRLTVRSDPGKSSAADYVFMADPVLQADRASPRRVVMIFVDTLRPDHLSTYGYARDTAPSLDRFAAGAARFTAARSVAPWTLPSTRAVLTGRQPEEWDGAQTIAERLGAEGWATAMFAGNVYLSSNFDMDRGWGTHRVENKPSAETQVALGRAWLDEQSGRDALLLVHFMDAHLDYREPIGWRFTYAGAAPAGLGERFTRGEVVQARLDEAGRQHVRDRYDNTIRYVHDQLDPLLSELAPDDVVVYFSDHGEEFWEHGGYEHGHTLYDELLRVPLVIDGPGVMPSVIDTPVTLLDVVPTIVGLLAMPPAPGIDGVSLAPALRGEGPAPSRDVAFGRPLYGYERWGLLHEGVKFTTTEGRVERFDLASDAGETNNLGRAGDDGEAAWLARLGVALGRPAVRALRLVPTRAPASGSADLVASVTVPAGIAAAWVGSDPTMKSAAEVQVDGSTAKITWPAGYAGVREVWLLPAAALADTIPTLSMTLTLKGETVTASPAPGASATSRTPLLRGTVGGRAVQVTTGISPAPSADAGQIAGFDPELASMLSALGYTGE